MPAPVRLTDPARHAEVQHELERPDRLAALHGTGLLDTEPEEAFDRWTRFLGDALGVRVSVLSLVDRDRQFFKSGHGDDVPDHQRVTGTPIEGSMCQYVVAGGAQFVVEDARADEHLA